MNQSSINFFLLFRDELTGFYKSNVMLILWFTLPILSILSFLYFPASDDEVPLSTLRQVLFQESAVGLRR